MVDDVSSEGFIQTVTMIKNISAYTSGSVNGDDSTGMNKESDTGENVGTNNYTIPQLTKEDLAKTPTRMIDIFRQRADANNSNNSSMGGR